MSNPGAAADCNNPYRKLYEAVPQTQDGYLVRQEEISHVPYGETTTAATGCGWMAAYNVLHALGSTTTWRQVHAALDSFHWLGGRIGTGPLRLARFLRKELLLLPSATTEAGDAKQPALQLRMRLMRVNKQGKDTRGMAGGAVQAGMFLFLIGWRMAHYVTFAPAHPLIDDGQFYFYNVRPGQDVQTATMGEFLSANGKGPVALCIAVVQQNS